MPPPRGLLAVLLAGRILQWQGCRIVCDGGESYPCAVLRVIGELPAHQRDALRETVRFLLTTDLGYGPFEAFARYQIRPERPPAPENPSVSTPMADTG